MIVLLKADPKEGKHRLTEILKDDGSFHLQFKIGDAVRMSLSDPKYRADTIVAFIGRGYFGSELVKNIACTEMPVVGNAIPGLNGLTVDELRTLAKKQQSQLREPMR